MTLILNYQKKEGINHFKLSSVKSHKNITIYIPQLFSEDFCELIQQYSFPSRWYVLNKSKTESSFKKKPN